MRDPTGAWSLLGLWRGKERLLDKVRIMRGFLERGFGLMGRKRMPPSWGQALLFPDTRSLHTFGMRFALDIAFLDRGGQVLKILANVPPGRAVVGPQGSRHALEAPAGTLGMLREGDRLEWK
jgi:uncharacterized membrane protein (UPF0127 family)